MFPFSNGFIQLNTGFFSEVLRMFPPEVSLIDMMLLFKEPVEFFLKLLFGLRSVLASED